MNQRSKSVLIKSLVAIVSIALISTGLLGILQQRPKEVNVIYSSYSESLGFVVEDSLSPNLLYGNTTLINPNEIFTNISKEVNVTLEFSISQTKLYAKSVAITSKITLISVDPAWSKVISQNTISKDIVSSGFTTKVNLAANFTSFLSLAKTIDEQLGGTFSSPSVFYNASVKPFGIDGVNTGISFVLSPQYYSVYYPNQTSSAGKVTHQELKNVSLIVPLSLLESYVVLGAGVASAGYLSIITIPRNPDEIKRQLKDRFEDVIEVDRYITENSVRLKDVESLFKISDTLELPVFLNRNEGLLFVEHQQISYYAELKK